MYLSTTTTISPSDILMGQRWVSSLPVGVTSSVSISAQIPSNLTPGTYYFGLIVDNTNNVAESNKLNNIVTGNKIVISQ